MSIVMRLDQHRAQITAESLDTTTGEVARGRVVPADRSSVGKFGNNTPSTITTTSGADVDQDKTSGVHLTRRACTEQISSRRYRCVAWIGAPADTDSSSHRLAHDGRAPIDVRDRTSEIQ
ncbi:MAG: hypothetical protein ACYC91_16990 [Solirubrobacteraceae bacterium]